MHTERYVKDALTAIWFWRFHLCRNPPSSSFSKRTASVLHTVSKQLREPANSSMYHSMHSTISHCRQGDFAPRCR